MRLVDTELIGLPKDHFVCANCREHIELHDLVLVSSKSYKGVVFLSHADCSTETANLLGAILKHLIK